MKIPTFEEYISERLFKSSIDRVKSDGVRKEERGDLSSDEYKIYKVFSDWSEGGRFFIKKTDSHNEISRRSITYDEEKRKIFNGLDKLGCSKISTFDDICNALKNNLGVCCAKHEFINRYIMFLGMINENLYTLWTNFNLNQSSYSEKTGKLTNLEEIKDLDKIYIIPQKVVERIITEQSNWNYISSK